jgi:hypothetical protein
VLCLLNLEFTDLITFRIEPISYDLHLVECVLQEAMLHRETQNFVEILGIDQGYDDKNESTTQTLSPIQQKKWYNCPSPVGIQAGCGHFKLTYMST